MFTPVLSVKRPLRFYLSLGISLSFGAVFTIFVLLRDHHNGICDNVHSVKRTFFLRSVIFCFLLSYSQFGFECEILVLIVPVPGHCLPSAFHLRKNT